MSLIIQFSERLKELIDENQLSIDKLSKETGLNVYNIHHWVSAKMNYMPNLAHILKLADNFNCSVDFLIGLADDNYLSNPKKNVVFSKWFRTVVEKKGYTLFSLGKATKITTNNFYKWINGKRNPSLDSLIRIAGVLNCSIDYLLGRE